MGAREYFIYLISCLLNGEKPQGSERTDWQGVYALAEAHDAAAAIACMIEELPQGSRPQGSLLASFESGLKRANRAYERQSAAMTRLIETLTLAGADHLIVKGAVLRYLYKMPQLRTGRDIDVILRPSQLEAARSALLAAGFEQDGEDECRYSYDFQIFDIHTELESINVQSKIYYSTPFDDISENSGCTYKLKPIYHLLYVITHTACHLKKGGCGVRMITDIDAILRYYPDIDMAAFSALCDNIRIRATAQALIALSKKWFHTPVAVDYSFEDYGEHELYEALSSAVLSCEALRPAAPRKKEEKSRFGVARLVKRIGSRGKKQEWEERRSPQFTAVLEELEEQQETP